MFRQSILLLVFGVTLSSAARSETVCAPEDEGVVAAEMLETQIQAFNRTEFGIALAKRAELGELVSLRSDTVSIDQYVTQPGFTKSRDFAYAKALANVQAKFIVKKQADLSAQIATERYDAEPAPGDLEFTDEDPGDEWVRIGGKLLRLTEAKLDNALREEGVAVEEIEEATREKRFDLFRESITRRSSRSAFGSAAGLIPVKSFEAVDCSGRAAVSILAVYSEKNREFVTAIHEKHSFKPDPDRVAEVPFISSVDTEIQDGSILYEWGIRKLYDTSGLPLLASYGQWGYVPQEGMPKANERRRRSALIQADAGAIEQLTLFLNSDSQFLSEASREEFANSFLRLIENPDGTQRRIEEDVSAIVQKSSERFRTSGTARVTGLSDPIHWDLKYPHNDAQARVVGSVVYWSPRAEDAINQAIGVDAGRIVGESPKAISQGEAQLGGSKVKNNADDF